VALTKQEAENRLSDACKQLGLPLEVRYVGKQRNVPDEQFWGGKPSQFRIHETANSNVGADARMHRNFVANGGGTELASFSLCVDSKRLVLIVDLTKATYHAGTAKGNYTSGSIETCVNSDGNWAVTKDNLAKATAAWLSIWDGAVPLSEVHQHNYDYGKDCPHIIRKEGSWQHILDETERYLEQLQGTAPPVPTPEPAPGPQPPAILTFPGIAYSVQHGFRDKWLKHGLEEYGYPISNEYDETIGGNVYTLQDFERVQMQYTSEDGVSIGAFVRRTKLGY
jgi:hypothetical protein